METLVEKTILIPLDHVQLTADLSVPALCHGIVVFAHGSGSSRLSSRNRFVAGYLQKAGFATLLFDLLTAREDEDYSRRFDIQLLTDRLIAVTDWLKTEEEVAKLPVGYFGASTGAAATLRAAAIVGNTIRAIVSRGGRPDLAGGELAQVRTPTLLIVGGDDTEVIRLNEIALAQLSAAKELTIVPGATHLFEEPGKLEEVARLAADWFSRYLYQTAVT